MDPMDLRPVHIGISLLKSVGGQGESIRHFHQALGGEVVSFTMEDRIGTEPSYIDGTIHVPVPCGKLSQLTLMAPDIALIEAEACVKRCNLIIVNVLYRYHVHWAFKMAERYDLPVWMVIHGALDPYVFSYRGWQKKGWLKLWGAKFLGRADRVIYATEREREKASNYYSGANTSVISWPVELLDYSERCESATWLKERFGIEIDQKVLLFLGRYEKMKRPLETIEAFAQSGSSNTALLLVGIEEQYSKTDLMAHASKFGVEHSVIVSGPIYDDEKRRLLVGADGFISLSWRENFGYTTAEAMSARLPVILSPGNDLASVIGGNDCGWLLSDFEIKTAAAAISDFDNCDQQALRRRGGESRKVAEANLRFEVFRKSLLNQWKQAHSEIEA